MRTPVRRVILFEAAAYRLGKSPEQLMAHIVKQHHFSNQGAVINQNIYRLKQTGFIPDYVMSFVNKILYGEAYDTVRQAP